MVDLAAPIQLESVKNASCVGDRNLRTIPSSEKRLSRESQTLVSGGASRDFCGKSENGVASGRIGPLFGPTPSMTNGKVSVGGSSLSLGSVMVAHGP